MENEIEFEWDEAKRRLNLEKHGLDFEAVKRLWEGHVVQGPSPQGGHGETRFLAYGLLEGRVVCVVFTRREKKIRIISARSARDHEKENYYKKTGQERPH